MKPTNDPIGDRMKNQYENRTRYFLPRRTYTIIRVDGKAFHTLTRSAARPYDVQFVQAMDETAEYMCKEIAGSVMAYVQSDEISILLTDFAKPLTEAWFDGNIQKMVSVSAALATARFNQTNFMIGRAERPMATFDSRVFTIPDRTEVENYFIWRQKDAERNSIQMLAQSLYSHKELHGKNCADLQDLIHAKNDNWNNHPTRYKRGGYVRYVYDEGSIHGQWKTIECPIFTSPEGRKQLSEGIPVYE